MDSGLFHFSGGLSINGHGEPDKVKNAVFTLLLK